MLDTARPVVSRRQYAQHQDFFVFNRLVIGGRPGLHDLAGLTGSQKEQYREEELLFHSDYFLF